MAVITHRIRFTTNVYVAPERDLFTVAKAVSTADV
jgi:alkanesulfonate monooxygenase SsuD/methylene tetrahydromethanopterin reductase-like flavin-dependent oxidoreductase (luciferase family)